ncbi:hypothetical protein CF326_g7201 [Tilletia indica]|nr:hypothetical protein CF326_g7201 [Tilletia indica]
MTPSSPTSLRAYPHPFAHRGPTSTRAQLRFPCVMIPSVSSGYSLPSLPLSRKPSASPSSVPTSSSSSSVM